MLGTEVPMTQRPLWIEPHTLPGGKVGDDSPPGVENFKGFTFGKHKTVVVGYYREMHSRTGHIWWVWSRKTNVLMTMTDVALRKMPGYVPNVTGHARRARRRVHPFVVRSGWGFPRVLCSWCARILRFFP